MSDWIANIDDDPQAVLRLRDSIETLPDDQIYVLVLPGMRAVGVVNGEPAMTDDLQQEFVVWTNTGGDPSRN